MRLAFSAATALSGLILLGLAVYGEPAVYVHEAVDHLGAWFQAAPDARPGPVSQTGPQDEALVERMAQLQQEVATLQARLAEAQAPPPAAPQPKPKPAEPAQTPQIAAAAPAPPEAATAPAAVQSASEPAAQSLARGQASLASEPSSASRAPAAPQQQAAITSPATAPSAPPAPPAAVAVTRPDDRPRPDRSQSDRPVQSAEEMEPARSHQANTTDAAEKHEPAGQAHVANRRNASAAELPDPSPPPPSHAAAQAKVAMARPAPAPRPETDDPESVVARLRQAGAPPAVSPSAVSPPTVLPLAISPSAAPPHPPENRPPASSPAVPRLNAARAALGAGRTDDAIRLLQEAQLQLVFRPVDAPGADPEASGQGASDVARALEALSANNIAGSTRYIERAMADLNGMRTNGPTASSAPPSGGYAPAYPPR